MLLEVSATLKNLQSRRKCEQIPEYSVINPVILPIALLGHSAIKGPGPFYIIEIYFQK